jgi:hypothetical protein
MKTHPVNLITGAGLFVLLASSLAPAQTGFVDATKCPQFRHIGTKDCVDLGSGNDVGPFTLVGEGARLNYMDGDPRPVPAGGTLIIRGGTYPEPIVLSKPMEIRADGVVTIGPATLAPFDLVADAVDANGLPLNPKWGAQRRGEGLPSPHQCPDGRGSKQGDPGSPACTNQFTYTNKGVGCQPHVNWFAATFEGTVCWESYSRGVVDRTEVDKDYNINLLTKDQAGYDTESLFLHGEFRGPNTIDEFDTPWWFAFRKVVDSDNDAGNRLLIDGREAIMTGLVSLDCNHSCGTELHPVYALAMNVLPSIDDDLWVLFASNWGVGGSCFGDLRDERVDLPGNRYTVRLPWKTGATSVEVLDQVFHGINIDGPQPEVTKVDGVGVFVTFTLKAPGDESIWHGEIHLEWSGPNVTVPARAPCPKFSSECRGGVCTG